MKKVIRLTESELIGVINRIINENKNIDFSKITYWIDQMEDILKNYESIDCENVDKEYEKFYCKNFVGKSKDELTNILDRLEKEKIRMMMDHFGGVFGNG